MISASISVTDKNIIKIFEAEEKELLNKRASYTTKVSEEKTIFTIEAKDATALRAVLNSICKTLVVYEKVNKVITNESK